MSASVLTEHVVARGKQWHMQRQGAVCLHIDSGCPYLSRYPFSKRRQTNRSVALERKDTSGSKWYHPLWVTLRELLCCAILFTKLDFLKFALIFSFSYLSQQPQSQWIAQQLSDPTVQKEVRKTLVMPWIICIFAISGCFFNPQLLLCHCSQSLYFGSVSWCGAAIFS